MALFVVTRATDPSRLTLSSLRSGSQALDHGGRLSACSRSPTLSSGPNKTLMSPAVNEASLGHDKAERISAWHLIVLSYIQGVLGGCYEHV